MDELQQCKTPIAAPMPENDSAATYRDTIRAQLNAIAAAVQLALRDADLAQPVFFSVPSSGKAILTFGTPLDPSEADWNRISAIICTIVGEKTGLEGLTGRELPCAVAAGMMAVADLQAG
jgi:hypothetical protein